MAEGQRENLDMRMLALLAIVFVVDGHLPLPALFEAGGLLGYYSFHMMLFAFLSGYFFRLHGGILEDAAHRARRLLLPLYGWNLAYGVLAWLLRRFGGFALGAPLDAYTLLLAPLTDGEHFVWNLGAWYLSALFVTQVMYAGVRRAARLWKDSETLTFAFCLAAGCLAVGRLRWGGNAPLWLMRSLVLLPGYAGGVLYRRRLERRDTLPALWAMGTALAVRALLLLACGRLGYLLSSGTYFDCGAAGVYLGGAAAIWFWLRAARLLSPHLERCRPAMYAARHTLSIMMHHYMGFFAVNAVFLLLNWRGVGAGGFSVSAFRTRSGYVYAPGESAGWAALYLLAGLALPLCVAWLGERLPLRRLFRKFFDNLPRG